MNQPSIRKLALNRRKELRIEDVHLHKGKVLAKRMNERFDSRGV